MMQVSDPERDHEYVALDDNVPSIVLRHLDQDTPYIVYGPGDDDVHECRVRRAQSDQQETARAFYVQERPTNAVIEIEDVGDLDDVKAVLEREGHRPSAVDTAYYYPECNRIEVWFYEKADLDGDNYPSLRHRVYRSYEAVDPAEDPEVDAESDWERTKRLAARWYDDYEYEPEDPTTSDLREQDA